MRELRGMDVAEDVLSVSARYGERETEEETDREIREIERANAGTRIQNRTQNPIAQTGERRSSVSFLAPKKNIYEERERHSNPPRGPLDATLKIEIERRHRAKDESNDAPRESQQSTIRQTFVLSYSLCVREMLRAFSRSMGFSTFRFDTPPPLFFFNQPRDPKHISSLSFTFFN